MLRPRVSIYAPQQAAYKRVLWEYMSILLGRWNGDSILIGDFNEVRSREERQGSCFNPYSARVFDNFISSSGLVDIKMEGYAFTWSHPSASKMSKLDRFLVTDGLLVLFPSITAVCLDRHLSDDRSILLHEVHVDFGPTPFSKKIDGRITVAQLASARGVANNNNVENRKNNYGPSVNRWPPAQGGYADGGNYAPSFGYPTQSNMPSAIPRGYHQVMCKMAVDGKKGRSGGGMTSPRGPLHSFPLPVSLSSPFF
nr:RNA-directed DNA polymerase, eukaryota [Tanacetum cinerariifolium]